MRKRKKSNVWMKEMEKNHFEKLLSQHGNRKNLTTLKYKRRHSIIVQVSKSNQ